MSARQSIYVLLMNGAIVLAVVVASVILGVQGTLDSSSLVGILGAAIGFAGGTGAGVAAVSTVVNGKSVVPNGAIADREHTLRAAFAASSASPAHTIAAEGPLEEAPEP